MFSAVMNQPHMPMLVREGQGTDHVALPLNLLLKIVGELDAPADLASACRTCRMLHYMCLPKLYARVTLHSYDFIRYSEETFNPEGVGGASPFSVGLNTLVTRDVAQYVQCFSLKGSLQEQGLEEYAQLGRITDQGMFLGSLVRASLDRMTNLKEFSWTLRTKMLPTVWEALPTRTKLEKLTVRMPSTRHPMPTIVAPALPNLTYLHVTDIDPACHPDNISELLFNAKKLEHLKLHFSPRMRRERDPSISLDAFFGRVKTSGYRMKLKSIAMQNLYTAAGGNYSDLHEPACLEEMTLLDSSGGADSDSSMSFNNPLPLRMPQFGRVRKIRGNKASAYHSKALPVLLKSARIYHLISGRPIKDAPWPSTPSNSTSTPSQQSSPPSALGHDTPSMSSMSGGELEMVRSSDHRSGSIASSDATSRSDAALAQLLPRYIDSLFIEPRPLIQSLLLFPQWKFTTEHLTLLARNCPNIEEIGIATEPPALDVIHYLAAHLSKLKTLRLLNAINWMDVGSNIGLATEWYETRIGAAAHNRKFAALRWVGIGDLYFEISGGPLIDVDIDGKVQKARQVHRIPLSRVSKLPLWASDVLEL